MYETIIEMFQKSVAEHGSRPALSHKVDGSYQDISYDEVDQRVQDFSLGLAELGIRSGDKVALLSENRPEWAVADLAALCLGAVTVPLYPTLAPPQIAYIAHDSDAKVLVISTKQQYKRAQEIRNQMRNVRKIVLMDSLEEDIEDKNLLDFQGVMQLGRGVKDAEKHHRKNVDRLSPDDLATIIYTSGTTGEPKGAMLTHSNLTSNVRAGLARLTVHAEDVLLSFLPLSHIFERMAGYYLAIGAGAKIAYAESPFTVAQNMAEVRPTVMASVPRLYELMHMRIIRTVESSSKLKRNLFYWSVGVGQAVSQRQQQNKPIRGFLATQAKLADKLVFQKLKETTGGRLRFFVSGGAPLAQSIAEFFHAAGILILEGYGLTETSPVITVNTLEENRFGTVGRLVPGVEANIAPDGEILTRGPHVMQGYYKKSKDTAEAIDADGWFHTGDIGEFDEDGYLKITDRKKNIIVLSSGKNVAPQPIENRLKQSRYINQILLIGDRRKVVTALIVPDYDAVKDFAEHMDISTSAIRELLDHATVRQLFREEINERMAEFADFEQVKMFALLEREFSLDDGEITPTLKLKRKVIQEKYRQHIEQMYGVTES